MKDKHKGSGHGIKKQQVITRENDSKSEIIREAVERAHIGYEYHKSNMDRAEYDTQFIFGDQYTNEEIQDSDEDNRLALTFNKMPQFVNKVVGQQRSTVRTINISPTGSSLGEEDPQITTTTGKTIKQTEFLTDLVRDIEFQSNAVAQYKTAFKHAVEGGFGWLRVLTKYQEDGFDLDAEIKCVRDRWSVVVDPDAQEPDKSDMNWAFISEKITEKEFNKRYPGKSKDALPGNDKVHTSTYWADDKTITVSEYFRREQVNKKISLLSNGEVIDSKDIESAEIQLGMKKDGIVVLKTRTVKTYKVIWCKMTQGDILEEEIEFPTSTIPLVPMVGRESDLRDKKETKGLIYDARDAQRALNTMRSSALERIDMAPIAPWVATDAAIKGYEEEWQNANSIKFSTLPYNKGEEKPTRDMGAVMPVAELQVTNVLDEDMKASIGIFNASLGNKGQEKSGVAIRAQQSEADVGTYEFVDNYELAIRRVGLLIVELIPRIYDTERFIQTRAIDGTTSTVKINQLVQDKNTGEQVVVNSIAPGKYTAVVSAGASYETKRDENTEQILELIKVSPKVAEVGTDLLVKNLDFSDSDVLADRLTRTIPPQLLSEEKRRELQQQQGEGQKQPTPEQQAAAAEQQAAAAEQKKEQMEIEFKKFEIENKVKIEEIKLEAEKLKLQTAKVTAGQKIRDNEKSEQDRENARKDDIAKNIAEQIKSKKGKTNE